MADVVHSGYVYSVIMLPSLINQEPTLVATVRETTAQTKYFRGVDHFEKSSRPANEFITRKAPVWILHCQDYVNRIEQSLVGDNLRCPAWNRVSMERDRLVALALPNILLNVKNCFQSFSCTIAQCVPLLFGAERPGSFGCMSVRRFEMYRVLTNLALFEPAKCSNHRSVIFFLLSKTRFNQSLRHKREIPQLRAIGSAHHHTFRPDPHEV